MRILGLISAAALMGSGTAPAPSFGQAQRGITAATDAEEICRPFLQQAGETQYYAPSPIVAAPSSSPATVASPAPPPPPPAAERGGDEGAIVVTGVRRGLQSARDVKRRSRSARDSITAQDIGSLPDRSASEALRRVPGISVNPNAPLLDPENRDRYAGKEVAKVMAVADTPVSTFAVDVDTGSYSNVRRILRDGDLPPQGAVRTEEMLNYFRYDYPAPKDRSRPFTITTDVTLTPWNPATRLLRVGLRGYDLSRAERPAANLVFLVDVSGSMRSPDKLPLVKCSLALLAEQLAPDDRVSIVVYAGAAGLVLPPTSKRQEVIAALSKLEAGGSTAGADGIRLAYRTARASMRKDGINRVILATDGDFNVGVTDDEALIDMVEREREAGITLTTLGFGEGNYNEAMMEQVADHGNGNYAYIDSAREARKVLDQELASTLFTIAKDVKIQVEFNPAYVAEYRLIGYENRALAEEDFDNDQVDAGDIGAGHQVTALYEIVPAGATGWLPQRRYPANQRLAAGAANGELAWLRLRYKLPSSNRSRLIEQPVGANLVQLARGPEGDVAFIAAVAGFGQKLRGDPYLGSHGYADFKRLANARNGGDYWRGEFLELLRIAGQKAAQPVGQD